MMPVKIERDNRYRYIIVRQTMSKVERLCAYPIRTVMFRPICSYCGNTESHYAHCDYKLSILACDNLEHQNWAERDAKAWLQENGMVRMNDFVKEPLFQETEILSSVVKVKRSSGIIEDEGWTIKKSTIFDPVFIRVENGKWYIPVYKALDEIVKNIGVKDLKMSLPEDKHYLVDTFYQKVEMGFYSEELLSHNEAREAQNKLDEVHKSTGLLTIMQPVCEMVFHPKYGYGRVFPS